MAKEKFYGMKNDYMFKAVLQTSDEVLRNLVATLMEIDESQIVSCEIVNSFELGTSVDSKECILDVKLILNGDEIVDLEIQVRDEHNWSERSLFYWARAYDSIKSGQDYSTLKKTYHIGILDFTLFNNNPRFYSEYKVMDTRSGYVYSDMLNIRILDLTRIDEVDEEDNPMLVKWAKVFKAESMKELEQLAKNEEVLEEMVSHIRKLSEDERIRLQCEAREDYERRLIGQYKQGMNAGIEAGREEGKIDLLIAQVKDGLISIDNAAKYLEITQDEFRKRIM